MAGEELVAKHQKLVRGLAFQLRRELLAFATPSTRSTAFGPMPAPVRAPPDVGFDDVTKG